MTEERPLALLACFRDEDALVAAARRARDAGYRRLDGHSPFPIAGLAEALGFRENLVPWLAAGGFAAGAGLALFIQWWTSVVDYPINVGGRPLAAWTAFAFPAFEIACLTGVVVAALGMLLLNGLPNRRHPSLSVEAFRRVSQDRFFLSVAAGDPRFDPVATRRFLLGLGAEEVIEVPP